MVTGALPFTGRSAIEVARRRLKEPPPSPRSIVPELEEHWESAILRCLSREPSQRFGRAEAVIRALEGREVSVPEQDVIAVARHTLPAERDVFVGRESELEELGRQLAGPAPIITLMGAAGMGKTRLAVRYGWRSLGDWPGGVWFCDLTEARDLNGMASAVARRLGIHLGREDPIVQIGQAIAGRGRCLVILDNFEQIASHAAETVGRWTPRAKEARFLVTSRERLGLDHEERVQQVEPLSPEQGLKLFEARARWLRPGIELVGREADSAREIVRLVDGMPLAIELAATRMRVMSADQIATQMRRRFQLLTGGPGTRHATLEAAIDGSWEMLREWERGAWTQCSVFEGGFTLEAAEAVILLDAWTEAPWVVDVIQSLVDKSLLRTWVTGVEPGGGVPEVRLGMYVSLQDYARMKLREVGGEAAVEKRHGEWYGQFGSQEALQRLNRDGGVARWRQLERELDNLMAACRRAVRRGDGATFVAGYDAVWRVLEARGPFAPAIEMGQEVLLDSRLGHAEAASILNTLGQAESYSGRMQARDHLEAALVLARELGDRPMERRVVVSLGIMHVLKGQTEEALTHLEVALAHARADGDQDIESFTLNNLGSTCRDLGRMEEARAYLELALTLCRALGNRRHEGTVLGNLGLLDQDLGHVEEARARYEAALAIHRQVGNRRFEGNILCNLGSLDVDQNPETARHYLNAALAIHRAMGDRRGESIALSNLGALPVAKEQLDDVRAYYEAALAIHRELGNRRFEGAVLMNLADVLHEQNRTGEAWDALKQAEDILRQLNAPVEICQVLCVRAELEHESGNLAGARDTLSEIEALAKQVESGPDSLLGQMVAKVRRTLAKDPKDVQART
jgi:predicted ATPase/Tfp pilus assembly protein PilF